MKALLIATGLAALCCAAPASAQRNARVVNNVVEGVDFTRLPGQPAIEETYPDTSGMPRMVQAYIIRWSDCQHWRGEYSEDPVRARQIADGQRDACEGVDALGVRVRARYANRPAVIGRIRDYDSVAD